jgi:two-component system nitrate/nitrite response regulator NarL
VRIVLGDCHRLFIDALAAALTQEGITVAALATSSQELLTEVARHQPDICLLATRFHMAGGLDILGAICGRYPRVKVVMLSDDPDSAVASAAIESGAAGVVKKDQHLAEIVQILARVRAGERALDADLGSNEPRSFSLPISSDGDWLLRFLTLREQEVLMLMMEGESSKQIAGSLTITLSTARTHVQSVLVKLGAHSRLEATSMVAQSCLLGVSGQYSLGPPAQHAAASG